MGCRRGARATTRETVCPRRPRTGATVNVFRMRTGHGAPLETTANTRCWVYVVIGFS